MAKLFGCPINLEPDEVVDDGSSIAVDFSRFVNQPHGEATSFSAGLPPVNQRETNIPYFRFLDSNSDSESESDPHRCFIDFFDRDSCVGSNQRRSSSPCGFDIWGFQDMEVEIELGLRIGSGSGSDDSGGLGLQFTEIDPIRVEIDTGRVEFNTGRVEIDTGPVEIATGRVEVDTGRVEIDPGRVEVDPGRVEVDPGQVEVSAGFTLEDMIVDEEEPVEANVLIQEEIDIFSWWDNINYQEDEPMDQEFHGFFDTLFDNLTAPPSVGGFAENIGELEEEYEDVLARTFEESEVNGSPPASKRVVDELPDVGITSEELSIGCAICKDEIAVEEKVKRLPCKHYYHGECIVPWLGIRNTCPVCRYELPTDDIEYERNKRLRRR